MWDAVFPVFDDSAHLRLFHHPHCLLRATTILVSCILPLSNRTGLVPEQTGLDSCLSRKDFSRAHQNMCVFLDSWPGPSRRWASTGKAQKLPSRWVRFGLRGSFLFCHRRRLSLLVARASRAALFLTACLFRSRLRRPCTQRRRRRRRLSRDPASPWTRSSSRIRS